MRQRVGRILGWAAVAWLSAIPAAVLRAAPTVPGLMGDSLTLPSGAVLRVWEVRTRYMKDSDAEPSWHLAYDLTDAAGSVSGIVAGTEDAAPDRTPRLSIDHRGRAVALVWSRWDGVYQKITCSRFEGGVWTNMHYLSFGRGDDIEPRIANSRSGAWVFWLSDSKYMAAPLELGAGRLIAAPKAMLLPGAWRPSLEADDRGAPADVTALRGGGARPATPDRLRDPGSAVVDSVSDSPVHPNNNSKKATVWGVGSQRGCARIVIIAPDSDGTNLLIYRFTNGATNLIKSVDLPSSTPPHFGELTANAALAQICN
jgi:hypothetical protein